MADITDDGAAAAQRQALRRHRGVATTLLIAMGAIYLAATLSGVSGFWIELLRAGTEAALVGGLADWFAVTALFRHPLGLPIPHTAVIPRHKDRIGQGLGAFIERHFLQPQLVAARLRAAGISRRFGRWLAQRDNAELMSDRLVVVLAFMFRSVNDQKVGRVLQVMLLRRLAEAELAPALATLLEVLRQQDLHQELFDGMVVAVRRYVLENSQRIINLVEERSKWWVPRRIDRRVATAITEGLIDYLDDLSHRDHDARANFDAAVDGMIEKLRRDPVYRARVNALRDRLLETPEVHDYATTLWQAVRAVLEGELAEPRSRLRDGLPGLLRSLGSTVAKDADVQARMDARIEEVVLALMEPWRKGAGQFVADVVRSWETSTVVDRVELAVGRDLQYIRVNGTLVGAFVGCIIFLLSDLLL